MEKVTLEEAAGEYRKRGKFGLEKHPDTEMAFFMGGLWQKERMDSYIDELRNDLYDKLPIGDVDAFEILKVVKNHLQKLDELCGNK